MLFNVKYWGDLEIWIRVHWRSLKMVPFDIYRIRVAIRLSLKLWPYLVPLSKLSDILVAKRQLFRPLIF